MGDAVPKGCSPLWNGSCGARECLFPYCREPGFDRAEARRQIAEEKAAALTAWKRS